VDSLDDEALEQLQAEHEALLSFVYMSPVGIVRSDLAGRIDMMNPLASQLLMPLVGAHGIENIFESLTSVAPELRNLVESFTAGRGAICEHHRIFVTPAHERAVVLSCSIIKIGADLLMTVLTDVSRQVAAERRARQTESWLAAIYTNVKDFSFFTLDAQGRVESWNASVERVTGFSEADALGHTLARFYSPGQFPPHRSPEHLAFARDQGWHIEECWCETQRGERYWGQILVAVAFFGQHHGFRTTVFGILVAAHQACRAQLIEQPHERRTFDTDVIGQRDLAHRRAEPAGGQQRRGARLRDVESREHAVARAPPFSGSHDQGATDGAAQFIEVRHGRYCISKKFVSKLLNCDFFVTR